MEANAVDTTAADNARKVVDKLETQKAQLHRAHTNCWNEIGFIYLGKALEDMPQTPRFRAPELDALIDKERKQASAQDRIVVRHCQDKEREILGAFAKNQLAHITLTKDHQHNAGRKRARLTTRMGTSTLNTNMYAANTMTNTLCKIVILREHDEDRTGMHSIQVQFQGVDGREQLTPADKTYVRQLLRNLIDVMFTEILYTEEYTNERRSMSTYFGSDGIFRNGDTGLNTLLTGESTSDTMFAVLDVDVMNNPDISTNMEHAEKFLKAQLLALAEEEQPSGAQMHGADVPHLLVRLRV